MKSKKHNLRLGLAGLAGLFSLLASSASAQVFNNPGDPNGRISSISAPPSVAEYARFEATFQVANTDANLQLPYDPVPPAYQANLFPSEDATQGISVDVLFLPPGQTNWALAEDQPAFWFLGYDANDEPTGEKDWHVRFSPNVVGTWQWRVQVKDAAGLAVGAVQSLQVSTSSNHGFLQIAPNDRRYVQFSDGTVFLPAAVNTNVSYETPGTGLQYTTSAAEAGAMSLQRVWLGSDGGLNIFGGYANSGGRGWSGNVNPYPFPTTASSPNGERFYMSGANADFPIPNAQIGKSYHFNVWVNPQPYTLTHSYTFNVNSGGFGGGWQTTVPLTNPSGWTQLSVAIPNNVVWNYTYPGNEQTLGISVKDTTTNTAVNFSHAGDDLVDDATGEAITDNDSDNYVTAYDQVNSNLADRIVQAGENSNPEQYFTLEVFQHEDVEWNEISSGINASASDGVSQGDAGGDGVTAMGGLYSLPTGYTYATLDTPTIRFGRYAARYCMARWGYSTAVRGFETINEADPYSSASVIWDQTIATAFHSDASDHPPLMVASYYSGLQNEGGAVDFADDHYYLDAGLDTGPFIPYDESYYFNVRGNQEITSGGPNQAGYLEFSQSLPRDAVAGNAAAYQDPGNQTADLAIYGSANGPRTIQGQGTWTLSYEYKTSPDVAGTFFVKLKGDGAIFQDGGAGSTVIYVSPSPGSPGNAIASQTGGNYGYQPNWTTVTRTFTVPDNNPHTFTELYMVGTVTAGSVDIANVRLTAPNGEDWLNVQFNEPLYNVDNTSFVNCLGMTLEDNSGDPELGRPLDIGETDGWYSGGDFVKAETAPYTFDATGNMDRQAAYGTIGSAPTAMQWWDFYSEYREGVNGWRFWSAMQKFISLFPTLTNGNWRNVQASTTPGISILGQRDIASNNTAYLYVYNKSANWDTIANQTSLSSASGIVTVPGLIPGPYTVQRYDPATGNLIASETDTATSSGLNFSEPLLVQDQLVRIVPGSSVLFYLNPLGSN